MVQRSKEHVENAETAMFAYTNITGSDLGDDSLVDLFTDLLHWADSKGIDWEACFDTARDHRLEEIRERHS